MKSRSRFDYVKYDEDAAATQASFKTTFQVVESLVHAKLQSPRYKALALTALEEAYAWIGKAIRDDQIERDNETELQEERSNG